MHIFPDHRTHTDKRYFGFAATLALVVVGTLIWLHVTDFYHRHFFDVGIETTEYEFARLIFLFALPWLVYAVGAGAMAALFGRRTLWTLAASERYLLGFLAGAGIWHWCLFGLGLGGLYIWLVAFGLASTVMLFSVPHLAACIQDARLQFSQITIIRTNRLLTLLLIIAMMVFVLNRGLYPLGGHDYYDHYFPYLIEVVQNGNILPNSLWFHFYYSKGVSLFFLAILLTDPIAPALVTTVFVGFGAWLVWAMLLRESRHSVLPLIGATLFIAFFVVGNDDLEKPHDLEAFLLLGVIWISSRLFFAGIDDRRPWRLALHLAATTIVVILLEYGFIVGLYLAGFVVWFAVRRNWPCCRIALSVCTSVGFAMLALAALNYHLMGLPLDQGILYFWPYMNLNIILNLRILFEVFILHHALASMLTTTQSWSVHLLTVFAQYLRLPLWWPLAAVAVPFLALRFINRDSRRAIRDSFPRETFCVLLWFTATIVLAALAGGRTQVDSFERMASFSYGPTLCILLLLLYFGVAPLRPEALDWAWARIIIAIIALANLVPSSLAALRRVELSGASLTSIFVNSARLLSGKFSLKDAYQNQQGWNGKLPWGGIYPGIVTPWKIAGPHTPIYTFHIHSYCMLPDCYLEQIASFRFAKRWQTPFEVFYGDADTAEQALKADGLNYFFFSKELQVATPLGTTPLFSPSNVANHLAIRWTDGTSYLLTWPGPETTPIDRSFLVDYSDHVKKYDYKLLDYGPQLYAYVLRHADNLRPFALPWCMNCSGLPTIDR